MTADSGQTEVAALCRPRTRNHCGAAWPARALRGPALLLGVSLGGFFDGILLHQILQWHHLLSAVDAARDLRTQMLADGLFHALMYLIAVVALYHLWRRRTAASSAGATQMLCGGALLGFGLWHGADAVLSHWIAGIHRIRMDAAQPLAWDLAWVIVFGLLPAALGARLLRRRPDEGRPDDDGGGAGGARSAVMLALAVVVCGPLAALPAGSGGPVMVVFAPGISPAAALNALGAADARVLWVDHSGGLWAVKLPDHSPRWLLHRSGALMVGGAGAAFGCLAWARPAGTAGATNARAAACKTCRKL